MNLDQKLEAILFAAGKPLSIRKLVELSGAEADDVREALGELSERLQNGSGLILQEYENDVALATNPEAAEYVKKVVKDETMGELTKASLEALTILAYRGPMTRPELEQIRGVQSSMILRNLMIRGLAEQKEDQRLGQPTYAVTFDFLKHLGLKSVSDLPDYEKLRGHAALSDMLDQLKEDKEENQENSQTEQEDLNV
ncbi:MAG: SMC-Scp complex subunit ScpB [Patescibacteria group bacterium]